MLALVKASRSAAYAALIGAMDAGFGRVRDVTPRFDRRGFPLDLKDRAARRAQLRHRAVTGAVVAAVVAAPVLALWAACRAAPLGDDQHGSGGRASASEPDGLDGLDGVPYEKAGSSRPSGQPDSGAGASASGVPAVTTVAVSSSAAAPPPDGSGYLTVTARARAGTMLITLTADGATPVHWEAGTYAYWLRFSAHGGTLKPGESITLGVTVDRGLEPAGSWTAAIRFSPGHTTVTLQGTSPRAVPRSSPSPTAPASPVRTSPTTPPPTTPATTAPTTPPSDTPSPTPSTPAPTTAEAEPSPTTS